MVDALRTEMHRSIPARKTEKEKELEERREQLHEKEFTKCEETCNDFKNYSVCNTESLECMIYPCEECPGRTTL